MNATEASELRRLLNEGIRALKANDRPRAREQLLAVLAADENNEAAWLWLSGVLDEPADQLMALERVLAINPRHSQALAGAEALRQRLRPPPAPAEPALTEPAAVPAPVEPSTAAMAASADVVVSRDAQLALGPPIPAPAP